MATRDENLQGIIGVVVTWLFPPQVSRFDFPMIRFFVCHHEPLRTTSATVSNSLIITSDPAPNVLIPFPTDATSD